VSPTAPDVAVTGARRSGRVPATTGPGRGSPPPTGPSLAELAAEGQVVGRRYHVPRFPLDPGVADRFAAVAGLRSRLPAGVAHPCLVARPALCVLHAVLADPAVRAERATMLHAQSDIVWHAPLVPGTDVELDAEIVDAGPYGNRHGLVVATRVAQPGGAPLVDMETVLAFAPPALAVAEGRAPLAVPGREPHDGTVVAEREVDLDAGFPARYAEASGDTNPIHLDPAAARSAGLPGVVLHGLSTVAVGASFAIDELAGGDASALRRLRVRFARPGQPGQAARFAAHRASASRGGSTTGRFALSCRVGGSPIWRQAAVEIRP
jgi:acyl dehydratase